MSTQPSDAVQKSRVFNVAFTDEAELPVLYANSMHILLGANEFFITIGTVTPPEVQSVEDFEALERLKAQPLIRIAVSPPIMKQFIDLMTQQYEQQRRILEAGKAQSEEVATDEQRNDE